ncbi:hypothetical protein [Actinopolymorpha pittospori]|uniref:Hydrolytic protein n=1 Tax=Actinopolymorpha pittospori TaxID=648752 RepID=A0A927RPZ2_9ACTN|nr:hypothetical protein [Actinopolymorpha pittospori]MBE1611673.1 hypothetical protein [Actinopolymorpha pittospori]
MATSAYLDMTALQLTPGGSVQCRVAVTNHGSVVESYNLRVTGDLATFASVEPPTLSLYPDAEGSATLTFDLPVDAPVEAGDIPFAVVVEPHEHPGDVAVPEGTVTVQARDALTGELTPRTSHGRRRARHSLAVDNRGNRAVTLEFAGKDPDALLGFRFRPERLRIAPGTAAFVTVDVRAVDRIWRGTPATRTFTVHALDVAAAREQGDRVAPALAATGPASATVTAAPAPGPAQPGVGRTPRRATPREPVVSVDGTMLQDVTLPSWLGRAVLATVAGAVALVALWFLAIRPAIQSTAQDAVADPLNQIRQEVGQARTVAEEANRQAGAAQEQAGSANSAAGEAKNSAGTAAETLQSQRQEREREQVAQAQQEALAGAPFNRRLPVVADPGDTVNATYTVPRGQVLRVTDLVFESPGDAGVLQVLRNDQVLLSLQPENFRDLDQHFVSPIIFTERQRLIVRLTCTTPAPGDSACRNATYVGGSLAARPTPRPTGSPTPTPRPGGR